MEVRVCVVAGGSRWGISHNGVKRWSVSGSGLNKHGKDFRGGSPNRDGATDQVSDDEDGSTMSSLFGIGVVIGGDETNAHIQCPPGCEGPLTSVFLGPITIVEDEGLSDVRASRISSRPTLLFQST